MSDRLTSLFERLRQEKRAALVTFITAGDPDPGTSAAILAALPDAGADIIELGVPFTDPMADGPAIQAANLRALAHGQSLRATLAMVAAFRSTNQLTPIILMGYANPVLAFGVTDFMQAARTAGVDGLIVVDLPPEEDAEMGAPARTAELHFIRMATPTTDAVRLPSVLTSATGFLYYVSMTGITGSADANARDVAAAVARIKTTSTLPVAVGFGIKTPEHAAAIARVADAVVVGSAIVSRIGALAAQRSNDIIGEVSRFVRTLADAIEGARI